MNPSAHKTDNGPERDLRLDVLRGVAIAAILVAHSNPPGLLFQLRNFDVPLMGMLVGASFALSRSKEGGYFPYLLSRILRLATPVWLFLTFLFTVIWIVCAATDRAFPYGRNQILSSYLLLQGIGLVWIIRVFVLVAALLPLVRPLVWKLKPAAGILLCLAAFGVYDAARRIPIAEWHRLPATLYTEVFLFSVPYTLLALLGVHLAKPSVKLHMSIGLAGMAAFGVQALYLAREGGGFVPTQEFKYPPQLYYLTYAIGASFLLSAAVEKFQLAKTKAGRALGWMGKQTMWIYLWHMLAIELLDLFAIKPPFMVRLMLIAGPSMLMSFFQHIAVERLVLPSLSPRVAAWVKRTFTG